jgi:hypothetical protein
MVLLLHYIKSSGGTQMKAISKKIRQTGVNLLSTAFILSTLTPLQTFAAENGSDLLSALSKYGGAKDVCDEKYKDNEDKVIDCKAKMNKALKGDDVCDKAKDALKEAEKDALEACRKAGMGSAAACVKKALDCKEQADEDFEDEEDSGVYAMANTISTLTGQSINRAALSSGGSCPQWGGKDFADRKETLDDKLKGLNEELAGLQEDIGKIKSDQSNELRRIQEDMNKAQEDLDKGKSAAELQKGEDQRKQADDIAKLGESITNLGMTKLDLENKFVQAQIDVATEMIKYSDSAISMDCLKKAQDYKASLKPLFKKGSGASGAVSSSKTLQAAAAKNAKSCVETFQKNRIRIMTSSDNQLKMIRTQIDATATKIENARVQLDMAQKNYDAMVTQQAAAQTKEEQALQKKMQLAIQEMGTLTTKMNDDLAAIETKRKNLTIAIASVNQSMSELEAGGKPRSGTEESVASASATVGDQVDIIDRLIEDPTYSKCPLTSVYRKPVSSTRSSSKGSSKKESESKDIVK